MAPRSQAREQFYSDIITTATEGGTNYWAYSRNYKWSDEEPSTTTVEFCDMEKYDDGEPEWHKVTMDTVANAFTLIRSRAVHLPDAMRKRYDQAYTEMDAGNLDAGDADNIVQIGMFGKLVYG
jgi:hypothetical protein